MVHVSLQSREDLVDQGYLSKSTLGDLVLYNYTDKCTYDRFWNDVTISCRGTVYNSVTGECVARAFDKFFNLNEHESTKLDNLPTVPFVAHEKMDGSLGILFKHEGDWRVCTRGSFHSEQAAEATKMLALYDLSWVPDNATLMFEIIYPSNRIIVNYGDRRELVLLGGRLTAIGDHVPDVELDLIAANAGFARPAYYSSSLEQLVALQKTISWQEEGFVLTYVNGFRVKVKGEEYMRIAKMKSCLSPISVWEAMVAGKYHEYAQEMPEELRPELEEIYAVLARQLAVLQMQVSAWAKFAELDLRTDLTKEERKAAALAIQKMPENVRGSLFCRITGKSTDAPLLDQIRPTGNSYVELGELHYPVGCPR